MTAHIRGMWADDRPLFSVRWVLQHTAMEAGTYKDELAAILRAPEQAQVAG